jgi:hypothetical protein
LQRGETFKGLFVADFGMVAEIESEVH